MNISVVIPVGPHPHNKRWLDEAIESVLDQTEPADEILIVSDGADLTQILKNYPEVSLFPTYIPLGTVAVTNLGVMRAWNQWVVLLNSDDKLLPECIRVCKHAWERIRDPLGWYYLGIEYSDGMIQNTPTAAAMFHKRFFEFTGGFPMEAAVGNTDHIFTSVLLSQKGKAWLGDFYQVSETPLYYHRAHSERDTDTRESLGWQEICYLVRTKLEKQWLPWEVWK